VDILDLIKEVIGRGARLFSLRCSRSILPITECKLSLPYSGISLYNTTTRFI